MFNEASIEQMIIDTLIQQGWEYIPADNLPRKHSDVMVEPMVREALIRLNPEIAEDPSRADEVIIRLRPLFMQAKASDLVTLNESLRTRFSKRILSSLARTTVMFRFAISEWDQKKKWLRIAML